MWEGMRAAPRLSPFCLRHCGPPDGPLTALQPPALCPPPHFTTHQQPLWQPHFRPPFRLLPTPVQPVGVKGGQGGAVGRMRPVMVHSRRSCNHKGQLARLGLDMMQGGL